MMSNEIIREYALNPSTMRSTYDYDILENGISVCGTGTTRAEYENLGYTILSETEFHRYMDHYYDGMCNFWKEITEEQYNDALDILPPAKWLNGGFFVPEAVDGNVYDFYQELNGKYYTSLQRSSYKRADILENLNRFIDLYEDYQHLIESWSDPSTLGEVLNNAIFDDRWKICPSTYEKLFNAAAAKGYRGINRLGNFAKSEEQS